MHSYNLKRQKLFNLSEIIIKNNLIINTLYEI